MVGVKGAGGKLHTHLTDTRLAAPDILQDRLRYGWMLLSRCQRYSNDGTAHPVPSFTDVVTSSNTSFTNTRASFSSRLRKGSESLSSYQSSSNTSTCTLVPILLQKLIPILKHQNY